MQLNFSMITNSYSKTVKYCDNTERQILYAIQYRVDETTHFRDYQPISFVRPFIEPFLNVTLHNMNMNQMNTLVISTVLKVVKQ